MFEKLNILSKNSNIGADRFRTLFCSKATTNKKLIQVGDEYSPTPLYPTIERKDVISEEEVARLEWHDKIKRQRTVEEKLLEVNVPRRWGWICFMIHEGIIPFNNLTFAQHMTKTHVIKTENLTEFYNKHSKRCSEISDKIKSEVVECIEYQLSARRGKELQNPEFEEKKKTKYIANELHRIILTSISSNENHLHSAQQDFEPRLEASWKINSLVETAVKKQNKDGIPLDELPEEYLDRPSDKFIQYIGHPILQLRHSNPLPSIVDLKEANIFNYSVPIYEYDPHLVLGYDLERRHVTNIPGFWPGDDNEFSFLSYHCMNHLNNRPPSYGSDDLEQAACSQILFASFGWLMSLACYHGFSSYHDVTYPFVTQTVLTDGQKFCFGLYQLNTTEMFYENPFENTKCNLCWMTPIMPLYESYKNGKLEGFNENVLKNLVYFYLNQPESIENKKLKPYLGDDIKHVADFEDIEKREWLEKEFKHFCANKPTRTDLMYEVHDWERIFKIMYRQRPMDARRRPFELRENPYRTPMNSGKGKYIPKALRPDRNLPKWRQRKFARRFYPE